MKTVIVNGGNIETDFALSLLKKEEYDYLIAADSGLEFTYKAKILPDEILGDFDSVNPEIKEFYDKMEIPMRTFPPEKDYTDMELAMRTAIERGSSEIMVLGATGTRLDHVLGSIQNLSLALEAGIPCVFVDSHNRIRMIREYFCLEKKKQFGRYVSLIPHGGTVEGLTLKGFYYPLTEYTMGKDSAIGISNEVVEEKAFIYLKKGTLIMIESRD